jgi:hypothetical protein
VKTVFVSIRGVGPTVRVGAFPSFFHEKDPQQKA